MTFVEYFKENFYQKLLTPNGNNPVRNRADSLLLVFSELEKKMEFPYYRSVILETGCMRPDHGDLCFGDDGCFTYIADQFLSFIKKDIVPITCQYSTNLQLTSVDINQKNIDYAKNIVSDKTNLICDDSVKVLYSFNELLKFDLIYLDSFDIDKENPHPSQLHHLKELCAVMKNTKPGTIIVVDDHDAFFTGGKIGKGNYVKDFMLNIGTARILYEGYQIVFQL